MYIECVPDVETDFIFLLVLRVIVTLSSVNLLTVCKLFGIFQRNHKFWNSVISFELMLW